MLKDNHKKGFTIAELLIVVAIIAVLVAIAIPVFNKQLEKSRRAVDMANARSIQSALSIMINDGTIDLQTGQEGKGVWILVKKKGTSTSGYSPDIEFFIGADQGVTINGKKKNTSYSQSETSLEKEIKSCFGEGGVKLHSSGYNSSVDGINGWDWYNVEFYYDSATNSIKSRIYSGESGKSSGINESVNKAPTAIEKMMK